jgi:hypothetical protein
MGLRTRDRGELWRPPSIACELQQLPPPPPQQQQQQSPIRLPGLTLFAATHWPEPSRPAANCGGGRSEALKGRQAASERRRAGPIDGAEDERPPMNGRDSNAAGPMGAARRSSRAAGLALALGRRSRALASVERQRECSVLLPGRAGPEASLSGIIIIVAVVGGGSSIGSWPS